MWYSEAKDNRLDEVDCRCGILGCYGGCLYPLGKFVDCHQHVDMSSWPRFVQFSYHIETPLREGPGQWYWLQFCCWCMWLRCKTLTSLTFPYYVLRAFNCCQPVEPCVKSFSSNGSAASVMSAFSCVYVF
jgi:hypothetical protein